MVGFNRFDAVGIWFQMHIVTFYARSDLLPVQWSRVLCGSALVVSFCAFFFPPLLSLGVMEVLENLRLGPQVSVLAKLPVISAVTPAFDVRPVA